MGGRRLLYERNGMNELTRRLLQDINRVTARVRAFTVCRLTYWLD